MKPKNTLVVSHLRASIENKEILRDVSLRIASGEVHAVMGPNGSGKSTLAYALMGHPSYVISNQSSVIKINGKKINTLPADERAKAGLFLAFQSPIAIPGVSVINLLRSAYQELHGSAGSPLRAKKESGVGKTALIGRWNVTDMSLADFTAIVKKHARDLRIEDSFLSRGIHDGFSGGEKKKIEMLQALTLSPKFAIFDEIDTGLDVDALKVVARGVSLLATSGTGVIIITHYQRILKYLKPDVVHILVKGKIVKTGKASLAREIEDKGYKRYE